MTSKSGVMDDFSRNMSHVLSTIEASQTPRGMDICGPICPRHAC